METENDWQAQYENWRSTHKAAASYGYGNSDFTKAQENRSQPKVVRLTVLLHRVLKNVYADVARYGRYDTEHEVAYFRNAVFEALDKAGQEKATREDYTCTFVIEGLDDKKEFVGLAALEELHVDMDFLKWIQKQPEYQAIQALRGVRR